MSERRNFVCRNLGDGFFVCEDVILSSGVVCTIFISPRSIYVLSNGQGSAGDHYSQMQALLGTNQIRLYLLKGKSGLSGLYDPLSGSICSVHDSEALDLDINSWLNSGPAIFDAAAVDRMIVRLRSADIKGRGFFVQEPGEIFLYRHGSLSKASPVSSELQYYLTLFGGTLGLHRFALGKVMSGLVYLLTGGFFLVGWILDLLQLFLGIQKDRKKRYLFPLKSKAAKVCILPLGLLVGFSLFSGYLVLSNMFNNSLLTAASQQLQNTDPHVFQNLINTISNLISH